MKFMKRNAPISRTFVLDMQSDLDCILSEDLNGFRCLLSNGSTILLPFDQMNLLAYHTLHGIAYGVNSKWFHK